MKKKCLLLFLAALFYAAVFSVSAAGAEITDYDGYSFNQWVTISGDTRGASLSQVNNTIYMDIYGTGANGMEFTFEAAGNDQYYIRTTFRYNATYLCVRGKPADGDYYLGATTNKDYALKWTFGSDGRLHTTYQSQKFFLWIYCNQLPYNESDGFRLTKDTTNSYAVSYRRMNLTPPDPLHTHPVCGAECVHNDTHETIEAVVWNGGSSTPSVVPSSGTLAAGDYYLENDLSISKRISISGDVRICLNGHKLNFVGYGFNVSGQGSLEICDCKGTGSIGSSPEYESGYYVYEAMTISIGESASATLYDVSYCPEAGTTLDNKGTLTVYGGAFAKGIDNSGRVELYDCTIHEVSNYDYPLYNASSGVATIDGVTLIAGNSYYCVINYGELSMGGNSKIRVDNSDGTGISNRGTLKITDANITGPLAILNAAWNSGSGPVAGVCEVSGGSFSGGILNDGIVKTTTSDGVETTQIVKAALKITGTPSIDKIVLKYPDAFTFDYVGNGPVNIAIEISDDFAVGDVVFSHDIEKVALIHLLNEGYGVEVKNSKVVLALTEPCLVNGHSWKDATCTDPATCSACGETEGAALGHDWGDWQTTQDPTYTCAGAQSRACGRCFETEERPIAATGQAVVDEIRKERNGDTVTLEGIPADMVVVGAAYLDEQMVFVRILEPAAGSGMICVPEDTAWDLMKVFFTTEQWIPVARTADYRPQQNR